ncbi:hypothetical protein BGX38DRAFT_359692 [Terfezia claveryi]|nr:hypothetical protein BGX38DRAFT_359692 [Terfezia claveryi]
MQARLADEMPCFLQSMALDAIHLGDKYGDASVPNGPASPAVKKAHAGLDQVVSGPHGPRPEGWPGRLVTLLLLPLLFLPLLSPLLPLCIILGFPASASSFLLFLSPSSPFSPYHPWLPRPAPPASSPLSCSISLCLPGLSPAWPPASLPPSGSLHPRLQLLSTHPKEHELRAYTAAYSGYKYLPCSFLGSWAGCWG